jgi:pimeloyl-ACP methyl ester carboxylesterase
LIVDEHTIELAGSPIYYRSAAAPGVPPLYLHGVPTSSDDWIGFLARTGGLAPDLIGFGRSGKAGNLDYSIAGLTDFVESFLDHVDTPRVQLVAHDWGAAVGLAFAQRHPERVERIVLLNALPLLEGFRWHRLARLWRTPVLGELAMGSTSRRVLGRWLRRGSPIAGAWPSDRVKAVYEQFDQGTQRAILRLYRSATEQQLADAGAGLHQLTMPALIVWGQRDPWIPPAFGEAYAKALPKATLEPAADAGHWPWLDDERVIDRVAAFLDRPT